MLIRKQIKEILNKNLNFDSVDEFVSVNLTHDLVEKKLTSCFNDLNNLFNQIPSLVAHLAQIPDENTDQHIRRDAIQELVLQLFQQQHPKKQLVLLRVITRLVSTRMIEVRYVCEYMLNNLFMAQSGANQSTGSVPVGAVGNSTGSLTGSQDGPAVYPIVQRASRNNVRETSTFIWCNVLKFIQKLIPSLDYKSCRDIFKMLLEAAKKMPHSNSSLPPPLEYEVGDSSTCTLKHKLSESFDPSASHRVLFREVSRVTNDIRLESLYETISFLLDQENYFMPRYLAINEIKSVMTFGRNSYHPRFHYIITAFIESFIPTAHLISVSCRDRLLPVIGCSNLYSNYSFWKHNPERCKFNASGPLPYFKHVSKPHHDMFFCILRQNMPQYVIFNLMSTPRGIKTRFAPFEDELVNVIFESMLKTEQNPDNHMENLRVWNNLANQLINVLNIIHFPMLIKSLSRQIKEKASPFPGSRNWLMWFLLNVIMSFIVRNRIPEFSDLYEILYKDEEMLPNPPLNSPMSVIQLAPLSIWIHLNQQKNNQEASQGTGQQQQQANGCPAKKSYVIPEILQNHLALIQDMNAQNSQNYQDFCVSVCMNAYSTDSSLFAPSFNSLLERIGRVSSQQQQQQPSGNSQSPNSFGNSVFTNHQPLSYELISSFTLHVKHHIASYLIHVLFQKSNNCRVLNLNIPATIVETFSRLLIFDIDNFIKYFTQNLWKDLMVAQPQNLPPISTFQQQPNQSSLPMQTSFLHQQQNLLIEIIAFRLKHLSFTHRTTLLYLLNNLFMQQQQNPNMNYIRHPQVYLNAHIAMFKLLMSFTGSDHYELLHSILTSNKHGPKYFINPDSEEINKAIIIAIARSIALISTNKDIDDSLKALLADIVRVTPLHFANRTIESFPKVFAEFFGKEQAQFKSERFYLNSSDPQYKALLKQKIDADYAGLLGANQSTQAQLNFQSSPGQMPVNTMNTIFCMLFRLLQDESAQQNLNNYLSIIYMHLNGLANSKVSMALRTFSDYLVLEASNNRSKIDTFSVVIVQMINAFNVFTYDRLLLILTFRNFDTADFQIVLEILNALFVKGADYQTKYGEFVNLWSSMCGTENAEWNPAFYAQYIRMYPEKFFYEGLKEKVNAQSAETVINTYYGNMPMRCAAVLDFLNNRYIEHDASLATPGTDQAMDQLNQLYKFHGSRISYVYNTLVYYNGLFEADQSRKAKKKRLLQILAANNNSANSIPLFSDTFNYAIQSNQALPALDTDYYYHLIQRLVDRMLDTKQTSDFIEYLNEFQNPSCHLLYANLCELTCLSVYSSDPQCSQNICTGIFNMFFSSRLSKNAAYPIESAQLVYWINAAGLIIANLPEPYWYSVYNKLTEIMKGHSLLNASDSTGDHTSSKLFDHFDFNLAEEKGCFDEVTLIVALFHSIWCHSNANHFQYFAKFLKERREELIRTEAHFLFVCKLIGPYLSKIHIENTNLLINLIEELYDMVSIVDASNKELYHMETMCNFFYHLKYRHIGESIKEKIHSLMPSFRPELKKLFKYITSELNTKSNNSPQVPAIQQSIQAKLEAASNPVAKSLNMNVS